MTAPPVTAPNTTPIQPVQTEPAIRTQGDALEAVVRSTLAQTPATAAPAPTPEAELPRDPVTGRFLPKEGEVVPTEVAQESQVPLIEAGEAQQVGDQPPELPEGVVAVPELPAERVQGVKVFNGDEEIAVPDLTWKLTANGKERTLPTDKLLSFAQMGVYNHEREQRATEVQNQNLELGRRLQTQEQFIAHMQREVLHLLQDPNYYALQLSEFEQQNTPEARARRAEEEVQRERSQNAVRNAAIQADQFLNGEIAPALEQIAAALPTISREEIAARLFLAAEPYRVNGILSRQGFEPVRQFILSDLVPWAQQLHEQRSTDREAPKHQATKEVQAAQVRAQQARRTATQAIKPKTGRAMPDSQPAKPVRTMKDADATVIGRTLAAMRGG